MPEEIDAIIIDGSVVVNMIKPATEKTFAEYSRQSFLPYIQSQLSHAKRLDVVWDENIANSLKATTTVQLRYKRTNTRIHAYVYAHTCIYFRTYAYIHIYSISVYASLVSMS